MSWVGDGTKFISNSAGLDGGAIFALSSTVSWDEHKTFSTNVAGNHGGALALVESGSEQKPFIGTAFIDNSAGIGGPNCVEC